MHFLKQIVLGLFITWIVYLAAMGFWEIKLLDKLIQLLSDMQLFAHTVVLSSSTLSGFLTALFAKRKEWPSNTFAGSIIAMAAVLFVLSTTKESYGISHVLWVMSLGAVHVLCFSLTGFIIQKRRLNKLKEYNITDQRIDSFGEKFKQRK